MFIDNVHGWKGTRASSNITNIRDTRDWITGGSFPDTSLSSLDATATRVNYNYWYPSNTTYFPNQNITTSKQLISVPDARAIRIHFKEINMQNNQDWVRIVNLEGTVLQSITNVQTNVNSSWIESSQVFVAYESTGATEYANGYSIDYISYVPANETFTTLVESSHPYPANKLANPGWVLQSALPIRPYMRAHFSLLDIEESYDSLLLYNNLSVNYKTYNTAFGFGKISSADRWTPWITTNKISFNLTSDGTVQYDGFIVDKYQLSTVGSAAFDSHDKRMNVDIRWNNYNFNHLSSQDQLLLQQPIANYMRVNFSHVNFENGRDYLVLFDNNSKFLMDFTDNNQNVLTPWFKTNRITISYVSDGVNEAEMPYNLGAKIQYYEYTTATVPNISARTSGWTFTSDYYSTPGRASGSGTVRSNEVGLGLEIDGIDRHPGDYSYGRFSYEQTDKAEFYKVFPVPRGSVQNAYFSLDYYADKLMESNDFELYVAINDSVIFSRGFQALNQISRSWRSTGNIGLVLWSNTTSLFNNVGASTQIKFQVGIRFTQPTSISFSNFKNSDRQLLVVDDIKFVLTTAANATQTDINLRVNGTAITGASSGLWGRGSFTLSGNWLNNPMNLGFTTASPSLSFDASIQLIVEASVTSTWTQNFASTGTSYSANAGENVSWSCYENVYIPSGHQNYMLNVTKPRTLIIDNVKDPTGMVISYQGGGENGKWFSFTTAFSGWYTVIAHSRNYFASVLLSTDNSTWSGSLSFTNQQSVYIQAPFRVLLAQPSGNGTMIIDTPTGTLWSSRSFTASGISNINQGPVVFAPQNSTGGLFSGLIAWENGTEIGFQAFSMTSTHNSWLEITYPFDARGDNTTSQFVDSLIPVRILFNDSFAYALIEGATVMGSLNSTTVINFAFTESTPGIYDYNLDMSGISPGSYQLTVSATKAGFVPAIMFIIISINVDTRVDGFTSYQETQHGFVANISFHYYDVIRDEGISGASISVSFSGANYTIVDSLNGNYAILLNTTSFGLGTHAFSITVQKPFHEVVVLGGTFKVNRRSSQLSCLNASLTGYLDNQIGPFVVRFVHPDFPATINYTHASFTIYLDSWLLVKLDTANYTLANLGQGLYSINIWTGSTTPLNAPGIKELYIVGSNSSTSPFYVANDTAALGFILNKRSVSYGVYINSTNITTEASLSVGLQDDITLNMTVKDVLSGSPATSFSFTYNITGVHSGTFLLQGASYIATINHADLVAGTFVLKIVGSSPTYDPVQIQYILSVQTIPTYVEGFTNYQLREHGTNLTIAFHYHDAMHDIGVTGASLGVSFAGIGIIDPSDYTAIDGMNGNYTITLNTTMFSLGTRTFTVSVTKAYYSPQALGGTLEIEPRKSRIVAINDSLNCYLLDDMGPVILKYYHPDYSTTLNYTQSSFWLYQDSALTQLVAPSNYSMASLGNGLFQLILHTGTTFLFNTAGVKYLYILARNASSSAFHVAEATTVYSFTLSRRPVITTIFKNSTNITSDIGITIGMQEDFSLNASIKDIPSGALATSYTFFYNISNGNSGMFVLQGNRFITTIDHAMLSEGVFILKISGNSDVQEAVQVQYFLTVQTISTYTEGFTNYIVVEHGLNMSLVFHYHDAVHDIGIPGASIVVSVAPVGVLNPSTYVISEPASGNYTIALNTTLFSVGSRSFTVTVSKQYHASQFLSGTLEIRSRLSQLFVLNTSINAFMMDDVGPLAMKYFHPDYPSTVNYTHAVFSLYQDTAFTLPVNPIWYSIVPSSNGLFWLRIHTGSSTGFNTAGIKTIYIRASNSSSSTAQIANATGTISFILSLRPVNRSIHLNGVNLSGETSITANFTEALILNLTVTDALNGSIARIGLNYAITKGPSGVFVLQAGNYTANIMSGDFSTGIQVLSITANSSTYAIFSIIYLMTIVPRELSMSVSANGSALIGNGVLQAILGMDIDFRIHLEDKETNATLTGALANVTIDEALVCSFIVNSSSAGTAVGTWAIAPGFHSVTVLVMMPNYSAQYFAFTLHVIKRVINQSIIVNGLTWDGISVIQACLDQNVTIEFVTNDSLSGNPVLSSGLSLSVPGTIGAYVETMLSNTHSITFNASALGIGKELITFVLTSSQYDTKVTSLLMDILPLLLTISIGGNQTTIDGKPGNTVRVSINLIDSLGHSITGANVSCTWAGGIDLLQDMNNGTYQALLTLPNTEGYYQLNILAYLSENYTVSQSTLILNVRRQVSPESMITNTIIVTIILGIFFLLVFLLYLRPKIIKRRMVRFEEVKTCTVHKGPIKEGLTYVCPTCGSIYCTKCAQALFNNNDACWSCATPIQPFAVSYQEDWRTNLQYVMLFLAGSTEPIYEQSLMTEDVMVPEMLMILKKSIEKHLAKPSKKTNVVEVQEYFNSKILFLQGDFVTVVMVSRIDSSFIHDKMTEFVENWETAFYDKDAKTWKADARNKFATKTRFMIDGMFIKLEPKEEPKKGKGPKSEPGKGGTYVDAESLARKGKTGHNGPSSIKTARTDQKPPVKGDKEEVARIPVVYPEPKPEEDAAAKLGDINPVKEVPATPELVQKLIPADLFTTEQNVPSTPDSTMLPPSPPTPPEQKQDVSTLVDTTTPQEPESKEIKKKGDEDKVDPKKNEDHADKT